MSPARQVHVVLRLDASAAIAALQRAGATVDEHMRLWRAWSAGARQPVSRVEAARRRRIATAMRRVDRRSSRRRRGGAHRPASS